MYNTSSVCIWHADCIYLSVYCSLGNKTVNSPLINYNNWCIIIILVRFGIEEWNCCFWYNQECAELRAKYSIVSGQAKDVDRLTTAYKLLEDQYSTLASVTSAAALNTGDAQKQTQVTAHKQSRSATRLAKPDILAISSPSFLRLVCSTVKPFDPSQLVQWRLNIIQSTR